MIPELRPRSVGEVLDAAVLLVPGALRRASMKVAAIVVIPVTVLIILILLSALPDELHRGADAAKRRRCTAATPINSWRSRRS